MLATRSSYLKPAVAAAMVLDVNFILLGLALWGFITTGDPLALFSRHPSLISIAAVIPFFYFLAGLYDLEQIGPSPQLWLRAAVTTLIATTILCAPYCILTGASLGLPLFLAAFMTTEVLVARGAIKAGARKSPPRRECLVVGAGWAGQLVVNVIQTRPQLGLRVVGVVDDDLRKRHLSLRGVPVLGGHQKLPEIAQKRNLDTIIVAISHGRHGHLIKNLLDLKMRGVEVVDMPRFFEEATGQVPIKHIHDSWFIYSEGFNLLRSQFLRRFKRVSDLLLSLLGLVFAAPFMLLTAILIKLESPGPVLFRQERVGLHEKPFRLYKFRSMKQDAETETGPTWSSPQDRRPTRVGRWLRLTHLDEVPQFINIVKGDMSFIGPRPERPFFVEQLKKEIPYYPFRFTVKPGLTGWAQVNYHYGSCTQDALEKLKYDLYYIKHMSPKLDLLILLKTIQVVLLAKGT